MHDSASQPPAPSLSGPARQGRTGGLGSLTVALWIVGAAAVFVLPWFVPMRQRVVSNSYDVGFNNRVAMLAAIATTLLLCVIALRRASVPPEAQADESRWEFLREAPAATPGHPLGFWPALLAAGYCVLLWAWFQVMPNNTAFEMGDAISRIELLLLHQTPYRDFQFNYGPFFLYLPFAIVHASHYRVGADLAYIGSLLVFAALGLGLLSYTVGSFNLSRRAAIWIFVLTAAASFNLLLGMNYTLVRFVLPYAGLLALHRQANRYAEKPSRSGKWLLGCVNLALVVAGFAVSPDAGFALCLGCVIYLLARTDLTWEPRLAPFGALLAAAAMVRLEPGYLSSIRAYGGGGYLLPVLPTEHIVFYLACVFWTVPTLVVHGWRHRDAGGALMLAWAAIALGFMVPALGHCDPAHVYFNGFGIFLIDLLLLAHSPLAWRRYAVAFGLLFVVVMQAGLFWSFSDEISSIFQARGHGQTRPDRNFLGLGSAGDLPRDLALAAFLRRRIAPARTIGIPFGADEEVEMTLKRNGLYAPEHYPAPSIDVFDESALAIKLADTLRSKWLLVPIDALTAPPPNLAAYAANNSRLLSRLFVFPVPYPLRNKPFFTSIALADTIRKNYRPVRQIGTYWLAERR